MMNNIFPNIKVNAQYYSTSQTIALEEMDNTNLTWVLEDPFSVDRVRHFQDICHELSHFFDHIATLKGRRYLNSLYMRLHGSDNELDDNYFDFHEDYEVVNMNFDLSYVDRQWRYTISTKYREENIPFMMIDFYTADSVKETIASLPLSFNSLWEVIATATEIYVKRISLNDIVDKTEREIEYFQYYRDLKKRIYSKELLIYSAPVQFISTLFKEPNIFKSYALASLIASISFNIPDQYYTTVKKPDRFKNFIKEKDYKIMIERKDSVLMYLILAFNFMEKSYSKAFEEIYENIDFILEASNLPPKEVIDDEVRKVILKEKLSGKGEFYVRYIKLCGLGDIIFKYRGIESKQSIMMGIVDLLEYLPIVSFEDVINENDNFKTHLRIMENFDSFEDIKIKRQLKSKEI